MDSFDLKKYLAEGKLHEVNQPYEIISKKTEKSPYSDKIQDSYTPEGLTFKLLTQGYVLVEKDQEIDFDSTHHFYYIKTTISDEEGNLDKLC